MASRITNGMVSRSVLADINRAGTNVSSLQRKLSSGREITRPSDDPYGTSRAMELRTNIEAQRQYQRNVDDAVAWTDVTDVALGKVSDSLSRVRELTIQGGSDTAGQSARNAIASELDQLIESIKQEANASYAGHYVLAGNATTTRPYSTGVSGDSYAGNSGNIIREIGPGVQVKVNASADTILGSGGGDGKLLDTLRNISTHLKGGTQADAVALRTTDLAALNVQVDAVSQTRAQVGAVSNRLQIAKARLEEVEETTTQLLSNVEDADMAKTMVQFSMQQNAYQAALRSGAQIVQSSLLDFLRG